MIPTVKLQPKQIKASQYWIDDTTEEILYGGAKGGAKTYTGCALIFADALIYPGTHYFIARHSLNDLLKFTSPSVYEVLENFKIDHTKYVRFNGAENYFQLYNGSRVYYIDCKHLPSDPDFHRFGSLQFTRGWIEEIGEVDTNAIINLSISVGRWKNAQYGLKRKMLYTCNPNKGFAYNSFYLPDKKGELPPHRKFIKALPDDNRYLTPEYIEALERLPENEQQRLRWGNWEYDDDPTILIPYNVITDMFSNNFVKGGKKFIICDVARYGKDKTVITVWDDMQLIHRVVYPKSSMTKIQKTITDLRAKFGVPLSHTLIDEDGIGGGVVDNLNCKGFLNNGKPRNKVFQNMKAECGYRLAEMADSIWIRAELTPMEREHIEQELGMLRSWAVDRDGKRQIMPKERIVKLIGRSPDWLDNFIMRMFYEVTNYGQYAVQ